MGELVELYTRHTEDRIYTLKELEDMAEAFSLVVLSGEDEERLKFEEALVVAENLLGVHMLPSSNLWMRPDATAKFNELFAPHARFFQGACDEVGSVALNGYNRRRSDAKLGLGCMVPIEIVLGIATYIAPGWVKAAPIVLGVVTLAGAGLGIYFLSAKQPPVYPLICSQ